MNLHFLKGLVMWYMHLPFRIKKYKRNNERNLAHIRQKEKITVVFFASNLSMWRYQGLWEEMQKYPRYSPYIVLSPFRTQTNEQKIKNVLVLREFFNQKHIHYMDFDIEKMKYFDVKNTLKPDILFYPQPYYTVMCKEHSYYNFSNSLLAYYPYFFRLTNLKFEYDEDFQNRAWKLFYETEYQKSDAKKIATVGDENIVVTGYPNADDFIKHPYDVWKKQNHRKKRIIWAPHFTINNDGWYQNSCFLWMAEFMQLLAQEYKDEIQIAFKPHPKLLTELYSHNDWGKNKTDEYYQKWEEMENCQLETGSFIDLFLTSDAMIHDSGSFTVEYMYTSRPVMYMSENIDSVIDKSSEFAKIMYKLHYIGKCKEDIRCFIENIVLAGNDPLENERKKIKNKYLLPPNGKTCAENTIIELNKSLIIE